MAAVIGLSGDDLATVLADGRTAQELSNLPTTMQQTRQSYPERRRLF